MQMKAYWRLAVAIALLAIHTAPDGYVLAEHEKQAGRWEVETSTSPVDDSTTVIASVAADPTEALEPDQKPPQLVLRCKEGEFDLSVSLHDLIGGDSTRLTYYFGEERATDAEWHVSPDHQAAFAPSHATSALLEKAAKHHRLVVQITPWGKAPVTAVFPLEGTSEVRRQLPAACPFLAAPPIEPTAEPPVKAPHPVTEPLTPGIGGVTEPVLVPGSKVEPEYPDEANRDGIEGEVILRVVVGNDGQVREVSGLRESDANHGFTEAATAAVKQWRYAPATRNGHPVSVAITVVMRFSLGD